MLLPENKTPFCTSVWFMEGKCKLGLKIMFLSWISELDKNRFLFLLTKAGNEEIYWDGSGNIWSYLYNWQHESLLPALVIILIILFVL